MLNNRTHSHTFDAIADPMAPKLKTIKTANIELKDGEKGGSIGEKGKKRERKGVGKKVNS